MKKTIKIAAVILTLVLLTVSMLACSQSKEEPKESIEDRVASAAETRINTYIILTYEITGVPTITTYVKETGDNTYKVTGKVTVQDAYGDKYSGKYDAEVTYDPDEDKCSVTSYDVDNLTKVK